ncbi:anthranilate synthase component I family protein [Adhaeribacter rhizoryzae]|uniref:Anthranilate synthase component I family protein n=1 Tax=Adhaeribacter rhizoryzae TaxID=2607907 RepID=A0A5M6DR94_9BACT|nr:anthranilate synthase component I family protein [Adhaeribacter rhizoryzae]KAA5547935.1 anthranilate synthase component I family protein [Adhaeribacter rhizoryzae]
MPSVYFSFAQFNLTPSSFKQKALAWANTYELVAFYEHNNIAYPYHGFENILAVSNATQPLIDPANAFSSLSDALANADDILCGILGYDLKNQVEKLNSRNPDLLGFPLIYFFAPEIIITLEPAGFNIKSNHANPTQILTEILNFQINTTASPNNFTIQNRTSRPEYLNQVKAIQDNILEGDVYELNYCVEFFALDVVINPISTFWALNQASPTPFAGYFKLKDKYLLCASPERSLKKEGSKLISQPIKGTIRRSFNPKEDEQLREQLRTSEKEISENMMIMDLVRNDMAKSSEIGSVKVEEMFGIYGFQHLYQMITTVIATVRPDCSVPEAIKNAFPMGSMTGAPKIRAMELIDQYETTRRGLFSGSLGFIKPNGDFDFNVVIRSLQYNASTKYLSYMVGSAITYDSDPEQEYEECLLKVKAITNILQCP